MIEKRRWWELDSCMLHILAMTLMLSDHLWGTLLGNYRWLTAVGRLTYPIFAFMIAEGFRHTSNVKKYLLRMLCFAVISEVPFNLMMSGSFSDLMHQNVLWTFLVSLLLILLIEKVKKGLNKLRDRLGKLSGMLVYYALLIPFCLLTVGFGYLFGGLTGIDYFSGGIPTVLVFYFFPCDRWWKFFIQLLCLYYINTEWIAGMYYIVNIFGQKVEISEQGLAVLALIPIWLYRGKQGYHSKPFKYFCYAYYPAHMLILVAVGKIISYFS